MPKLSCVSSMIPTEDPQSKCGMENACSVAKKEDLSVKSANCAQRVLKQYF